MESQKKFHKRSYITSAKEWYKKHTTLAYVMGGIALLITSAIIKILIDPDQYIWKGISDVLQTGGYAILGAGVFAAIIKSSQFTEIFQKHIHDVFYAPATVEGGVSLKEKWRVITSALLKDVLPTAHKKAVETIHREFIESETEYHYENYKVEYVIKIDPTTNVATIDQKTVTTIVLSPKAINPRLYQSMESLTPWEITRFRMNGKDCYGDLKKEQNGILYEITLEKLKERANKREGSNDEIIHFERVDTRTQDLNKDPYIAVKIIRYTKGAEVRAKVIPSNYKLHFYRFGLGDLPDDFHTPNASMGFDMWQIALPDSLQLPGQGFVIIPAPL